MQTPGDGLSLQVAHGWTATIKNLDIAAFDLSGLMESIDEDVVGILGYPVFAHSVVGIEYDDVGDDRVSIFDPKGYAIAEGRWYPLATSDYQPVVPCRVNRRHSALFAVSTGSSGTVSFYSVFAANHEVLEGGSTAEKPATTICGESTELEGVVRVFEFGGNTFEDLPVTIQRPGSITDVAPGRLGGFIGRDLLDDFDVVFDMKNARIALIPE